MIKHLFIVACRNLLKYKQQTVISIIGLAVGFVCFALSAYWIRYEMGFDAFHENASQIYQVRKVDHNQPFGVYINTQLPLARELSKYFPEIKISSASTRVYDIEPGNNAREIDVQQVDSNFFELFDVSILSGSFDFNDENGILVTETFAREYYHTNNPIGKELIQYIGGKEYRKLHVRGVVEDWPQNTNLPFAVICPIERDDRERWDQPGMTYFLLQKGTDAQAFKEKFEAFELKNNVETSSYVMVPLTEAYYTEPTYNDANLKYEQVLLFAILGALIIVCALFNYLNLYANRIRVRTRELSLRKVNGASSIELFLMLALEFMLLLSVSCMVGFIVIENCLPAFKKFANIESGYIQIYFELGIYILLLIGISLLLAFIVIHYTRHRLFQESVRIVTPSKVKSLFGKLSLVLQMIISLGFIFCTTIYYKQIYTLGNSDPGFERKNIMSVNLLSKDNVISFHYGTNVETDMMFNRIKNIPTVETVIYLGEGAILPRYISSRALARTEKMDEKESVDFDKFIVSPEYINFYGLKLVAGSDFKPVATDNWNEVIINETMAKALGLKDPVGKTFTEIPKPYYGPGGAVYRNGVEMPRLIAGVVQDFVYESPLKKVSPVVISCRQMNMLLGIKCKPETYTETEEAIETLVAKELPGYNVSIVSMDEEYTKQYASEASLRTSLTLLSLVCVIISLFGIYSMVLLDCEHRRKEIAIRKVNGASLLLIFNLFFRQYVLLLAIAALVSFPVGYIIMKTWIEKYVIQTEIEWWIYPLIFVSTLIIVLISVTSRIWHTARINPSLELKKE